MAVAHPEVLEKAGPHPLRRRVLALLEGVDVVPGRGLPCDPDIHDQRFYRRVLAQGSLGLGEAYMARGDKENARKNYQKSLELNPHNKNALEMLKRLESQ